MVLHHLVAAAPATATDGADDRSTAVFFADQALFDLITTVWRTDTALAGDQEKAVVAHLHALADPLARPAAVPAQDVPADGSGPSDGGGSGRGAAGVGPGVRALGCLLEYAVHRARTAGEMPAGVLETVAGALPARGDQDAVATAIGVRLPALHRHAPAFAADHRTALYGLAPGRPSPAASWLRWGPYDRQVLTALDRAELLAALRDADSGTAPGAAAHTAACSWPTPPSWAIRPSSGPSCWPRSPPAPPTPTAPPGPTPPNSWPRRLTCDAPRSRRACRPAPSRTPASTRTCGCR